MVTTLLPPRLMRSGWTALLLGALSAVGFAPLHLWPVTLLCFAMLIAMLDRACAGPRAGQTVGRRAFLLGWAFGVGHFTVGLNWIAHAFTFQDKMPHWLGYGAVFLLSLYLAVYPALATLFAVRARRRWPNAPVPDLFAAAWIVSEYLRGTLFSGFAWNPLGAIWLDTGVDQTAMLIGTYGLSGLAVLAGGALLALARGHWRPVAPLCVGLLIVAGWGTWRTHAADAAPGSRPAPATMLTVVQPNINQDEKHDPVREAAAFLRLENLSRLAPGAAPNPAPRLLLWPESAVPAWLDMEPGWRERIAGLLRPGDLLATGNVKVYLREVNRGLYTERVLTGARNAVWVMDAKGRLLSRYDKSHLVPYGEYLPMRWLLSPLGLSRLVPGDTDFLPGPGPRSLPLPATAGGRPLKMGVQICYEMIFSGHVVDRSNRPDFLFNPSNDAWFGAWGPPQHLAQARLRAIEEAMPVVRSTPTGISAVVDARGRLLASIPHHQAGVITMPLPPSAAPTPFARLGNWLPMFLALGLFCFAAASHVVMVRKSR